MNVKVYLKLFVMNVDKSASKSIRNTDASVAINSRVRNSRVRTETFLYDGDQEVNQDTV